MNAAFAKFAGSVKVGMLQVSVSGCRRDGVDRSGTAVSHPESNTTGDGRCELLCDCRRRNAVEHPVNTPNKEVSKNSQEVKRSSIRVSQTSQGCDVLHELQIGRIRFFYLQETSHQAWRLELAGDVSRASSCFWEDHYRKPGR